MVGSRTATSVGGSGVALPAPGYRNIVLASPAGARVVSVTVDIDTAHVSWSVLEGDARAAMCAG